MASTRLLLLLALIIPTKVTAQNLPVPKEPQAPKINQPIPPPPKNLEIIENKKESENNEELDSDASNAEEDANVPKKNENPFEKPNIDNLIQKQFNDDMWRIMRGGLPCLEASALCLQQLQERAVSQSPLLREIDQRVAEANEKINEAKAKNKKVIQLAVLTPALQYLLGPTPVVGQPQPRGLLDNLGALFRGNTGIINALFNVVGVPLFQGLQGGNADAQRNAIAIGDLQIKVVELQRARAQLAETTREKVAIALVKFDEARTEFQTSQVVGNRAIEQFKVFELRYVRGNSDTESYLAKLNSLDNQKAQVYSAWAKMRRNLFEIKLLVLSVKDAEI